MKRIITMLLMSLLCMINMFRVTYALNDQVAFFINQDSDIAFSEEDEFCITVALSGTEDFKEISLKPYEIQDSGYYVPMEEGLYVVKDINYKGKNDKIRESGYGIGATFHVSAESFCGIDLNVGGDSVKRIIENNAHYVVKQEEKAIEKIDKLVTKQDKDNSKKEQQIKQEKEEKQKTQDKKRKKISLLLKGIPIVIISIIGSIIIFILHKNKKI